MRTAAHISDTWASGGPFIGEDAQPHTRVTVQAPWSDLSGDHKYDILRATYDLGVGIYAERGIPLRWFQNLANDELQIELTNIATVHTSRSIDQDAASFDISIYNQQMYSNTGSLEATETGQPGYFSFNRGVSLDAQGRWSQTKNAWENLLVPNAILRTYQGYGGTDKTIGQAVTDGNLILTGVWFVDTVTITTNGRLQLKGRDAAKLLLDQMLYLPLVPKNDYPLTYYRWVIFNAAVNAAARTVVTQTTHAGITGDKVTNYETSSVDAWYDSIYGHDMLLNGHHPSDAFDGNEATFFLGEGNSRPDAEFAVNYLQATCGEQMNAVYVSPWAGNYTMYVSVMENGVWQGDPNNLIYYDPSILFGTQPYAVDTGGAIPYVASFGVPWETPQEYTLPRVYQADRVRVTFRDLTYTDFGPWHFRAGVREFKIRGNLGETTTSSSVTSQPLFIAADSHPTAGYVTCDMTFDIDAFGDARVQSLTGGQAESNEPPWSLRVTHTGLGYYVMTAGGRVTCYGDAVYYGDPQVDGFVNALDHNCADMAITPSGHGYWCLDSSGGIYNYGDAAPYADVVASNNGSGQTFVHSIESHPSLMGVWVLDANGKVFIRGALSSFGDLSPMLDRPKGTQLDVAVKIRSTLLGDGYWLMTTAGLVQGKGAATVVAYPPAASPFVATWSLEYWGLLPHADDSGFLVMRGTGDISDFGLTDGWFYGSPIPGGVAQLRTDGNYLDYTDIIRDLALWSGFLLYDPATAANAVPSVHGNLESTGAFSPEPLPTDIFDKKPVIDAMHAIKEIVGYLLWVDEEGGLRFESPNWWAPGNFDEDGNHTQMLPVLDELVTLIDYSSTTADDPLRSQIIISSLDPDQAAVGAGTVTTRLKPTTAKRLRGLCKPAMWVNGYFLKPEEQKLMAELISLHINFQSRIGQVTCSANPCLQINDQVRIFERQTAETFVHYVRGVDTSHDLDTGEFTMTVTTHWLGDETNWAIQAQGEFVTGNEDDPNIPYTITPALVAALRDQFGSSASSQFGHRLRPANTSVATGSQGGVGAGPN